MTNDLRILEKNIAIAIRLYCKLCGAYVEIFNEGAHKMPIGEVVFFQPDWNYQLPLARERSGFDINVTETTQHWVKLSEKSENSLCLYVDVTFPRVVQDIFAGLADHQLFEGVDLTISGRLHLSDGYVKYDGFEFDLPDCIECFELDGYTQAFFRDHYGELNARLEPFMSVIHLFFKELKNESDEHLLTRHRIHLESVLIWVAANRGARVDHALLLCELAGSLEPILRIAARPSTRLEA
jgi:hypothetical protein